MYVIILATLSLLCAFLEYKKILDKKYAYILLALVAIVLVIRYPIGVDIHTYAKYFNNVDLSNPSAHNYYTRSVIYFWLMYVVKFCGGNFACFLFVLGLINAGLIAYTIYKNSNNIGASCFIWLASGIALVYMVSALRQGLAMSFFFFGYFNFLKKKKRIPFLICLILSRLCHETAYIGFLVFVVDLAIDYLPVLKNKWLIIGCGVIAILLSFYSKVISSLLARVIPPLGSYLEGDIAIVGMALRILLLAALFGVYLFVDKDKKDKYTNTIYIYYVITLIYCAFSWIATLSRILDYFAIVEIVTMANMIMDLKFDNKKTIIFILFVLVGYIAVNYVMLLDDINYVANFYDYDFNILTYPFMLVFNSFNSSVVPY